MCENYKYTITAVITRSTRYTMGLSSLCCVKTSLTTFSGKGNRGYIYNGGGVGGGISMQLHIAHQQCTSSRVLL